MCISSPEEDSYISTNDSPSYYKELIATLAISILGIVLHRVRLFYLLRIAVRNGAKFKNKLMRVMVYFLPAEKTTIRHEK
jgi:hypothetical protein